jgi:hypothetical protein
MLAIATLGNEHNVVAIGTYCDNLPLIATNMVVAIDRNPCSDSSALRILAHPLTFFSCSITQ